MDSQFDSKIVLRAAYHLACSSGVAISLSFLPHMSTHLGTVFLQDDLADQMLRIFYFYQILGIMGMQLHIFGLLPVEVHSWRRE